MSDFKFSCPFCDRHLQAEPAWAGIVTQCPDCGNKLTIPTPETAVLKPYADSPQPLPPAATAPQTYPVPGIKHTMPAADSAPTKATAPMPQQPAIEKAVVKPTPVTPPPAAPVAEVKPVPVTPPAPVAEVKPVPVTPPAAPVAEVKPEPVAPPAPVAEVKPVPVTPPAAP
ncbi:MAG: hypothetical protein E7047_07330, partial [Lentisphaerae bacterium]|nr:hypothetical protein [Lentisphaerota bacterium]